MVSSLILELSPGKTMSEEKKKIFHGIPTVTSHLSMHEYFAKKKSQNVETTAEQRRASGTAVECPSVKKSKRQKMDEDDIDVVANNRRRRKGSNTTSKHHGNLEEQTLREERNRKKKMNN